MKSAGEDLHVAGQHHEVDVALQQPQDLGLGGLGPGDLAHPPGYVIVRDSA